MTTRLATEKDIPYLETALANMGQFWGEEAVRDALKEPWITIVRETDGKVDGFYCHREGEPSALGPGDGPHESHEAWLKAICEMGIALADERKRRYPKADLNNTWIVTFYTPDKIGPLASAFEEKFGWTRADDAGPSTAKEGYRVRVVRGTEQHIVFIRWPTLVARAKAVLAALSEKSK